MIALRFLPLALIAGGAQAQMVSSDVPPPRAIQPVGSGAAPVIGFAPAAFRDTPPVMFGSADRHVPVVDLPHMPACRAAALAGMMLADDSDAEFDAVDDVFAAADMRGLDDNLFGR